MKRNVSVVRLIVATRSSGPPASGKIIKEMQVSVASGTPYINDQLDATVTILLIFESAQHVSGTHLAIFRSVRLWFTAMWCVVLML